MVGLVCCAGVLRLEFGHGEVVELAEFLHPRPLLVGEIKHGSVIELMAVGTNLADGLGAHLLLSDKTLVNPH